MEIHEIAKKMIDISEGNLHDIAHFLKVHSFAYIIGRNECVNEHTMFIIEAAALVHDIACPVCREKYGSTAGKLQEQESEPLLRKFFDESGISSSDLERIVYLVAHHHTYTDVDGIDHRILLEADFLVNCDEGNYSHDAAEKFRDSVFRTSCGTSLLNSMYLS